MAMTINNKNIFAAFNEVCSAVSQQLATNVLLEKIMTSAQSMTNADGASLYIKHGEALRFYIVSNHSLKMEMTAGSASIKTLPEIPLNPQNNQHISIASHCATNKQTINIEDISHEQSIDIAPTKAFDAKFNYKTKSILATPILDSHQAVLGVVQLINSKNTYQAFDESDIEVCEAMAALLSIVLSHNNSADAGVSHE